MVYYNARIPYGLNYLFHTLESRFRNEANEVFGDLAAKYHGNSDVLGAIRDDAIEAFGRLVDKYGTEFRASLVEYLERSGAVLGEERTTDEKMHRIVATGLKPYGIGTIISIDQLAESTGFSTLELRNFISFGGRALGLRSVPGRVDKWIIRKKPSEKGYTAAIVDVLHNRVNGCLSDYQPGAAFTTRELSSRTGFPEPELRDYLSANTRRLKLRRQPEKDSWQKIGECGSQRTGLYEAEIKRIRADIHEILTSCNTIDVNSLAQKLGERGYNARKLWQFIDENMDALGLRKAEGDDCKKPALFRDKRFTNKDKLTIA